MTRKIDLTDDPLPTASIPQMADVGKDEKRREWTRRIIASVLVFYLGAIIAAALVAIYAEGVTIERAKDILMIVVGPLVGLVGTVVGFYFGAQTVKEATQEAASPGGVSRL